MCELVIESEQSELDILKGRYCISSGYCSTSIFTVSQQNRSAIACSACNDDLQYQYIVAGTSDNSSSR